jgi:hypothetical protein
MNSTKPKEEQIATANEFAEVIREGLLKAIEDGVDWSGSDTRPIVRFGSGKDKRLEQQGPRTIQVFIHDEAQFNAKWG